MKHYHIIWFFVTLIGTWPPIGVYATTQAEMVTDTVQAVPESKHLFIMAPDPERPNQLLDSIRKLITVEHGDFMRWIDFSNTQQEATFAGSPKTYRDTWVLGVFALMLLFLGIIKAVFPTESAQIVQAFYSDRVLAQINKEDNLFSSWPFVFLYILFGFSCGLFLYLLSAHLTGIHKELGFQGFVWLSLFVLVLFSIKILVTRMLALVFQAKRMAREYISVLYLCYFNASLIFIPAVLLLSLATNEHGRYIIWGVLCIIFVLFAFRMLKTGIAILDEYQFPKFYLITYLCTLEIVPILILMKVLA